MVINRLESITESTLVMDVVASLREAYEGIDRTLVERQTARETAQWIRYIEINVALAA